MEKGPQTSEWIVLRPWISSLDVVSAYFFLTIFAQVLEFSGGILLLIEKAKTILDTMAADVAADVNQTRSGFPSFPILPSGASRSDPAEHIDHRPYLGSSPKGSSNLSLLTQQ